MASRMGLWSEVFEADILGGGGGLEGTAGFPGSAMGARVQDTRCHSIHKK